MNALQGGNGRRMKQIKSIQQEIKWMKQREKWKGIENNLLTEMKNRHKIMDDNNLREQMALDKKHQYNTQINQRKTDEQIIKNLININKYLLHNKEYDGDNECESSYDLQTLSNNHHNYYGSQSLPPSSTPRNPAGYQTLSNYNHHSDGSQSLSYHPGSGAMPPSSTPRNPAGYQTLSYHPGSGAMPETANNCLKQTQIQQQQTYDLLEPFKVQYIIIFLCEFA